MPIYEYQCQKCSQVHEIMQKFSDEPMKTCPECGGDVQKLMSMTSFALKGTGWYTTDYKKSGNSAKSSASNSSTPSASSSEPASAAPAPSGGGCSSGGCGSSHKH